MVQEYPLRSTRGNGRSRERCEGEKGDVESFEESRESRTKLGTGSTQAEWQFDSALDGLDVSKRR